MSAQGLGGVMDYVDGAVVYGFGPMQAYKTMRHGQGSARKFVGATALLGWVGGIGTGWYYFGFPGAVIGSFAGMSASNLLLAIGAPAEMRGPQFAASALDAAVAGGMYYTLKPKRVKRSKAKKALPARA